MASVQVTHKIRNSPISSEQKNVLVEFLIKNENLKKGKFTSSFTHQDSIKLWETISQQLNSIPGAKKPWKGWRKTWQDMQSRVKTKASNIRKHCLDTGGGPPTNETLTGTELKIAEIIGTTSVEGLNIAEPSVGEIVIDMLEINDIGLEEHDYSLNSEIAEVQFSTEQNWFKVTNNVGPSHKISESSPILENKIATPIICNKQSKGKQKKNIAVQRLEKSIAVSSTMTDLCRQKIKIKERYYNEKLRLLHRDVLTKEKIARQLGCITNLLNKTY